MARPESIRRAWLATDYRVRLPHGGYASIRPNLPLPGPLCALLTRPDATWGYVTAWNPASVLLARSDNRRRQRRLRDLLRAGEHRFLAGIGVGASGWREPSLFVLDIDYTGLDAVARRFGQLGVLRGTRDGLAELHDLV